MCIMDSSRKNSLKASRYDSHNSANILSVHHKLYRATPSTFLKSSLAIEIRHYRNSATPSKSRAISLLSSLTIINQRIVGGFRAIPACSNRFFPQLLEESRRQQGTYCNPRKGVCSGLRRLNSAAPAACN